MIHYLFPLLQLFSFQEKEPRFETQVIDDRVQIGYGIAIGDVDGDGKSDILLADKKEIVWYRNGDWKRFIMAKDLTEFDNVCIAVRDLDRDGKVEVAVGAQWNPGETNDLEKSGSVHYLVRPNDPTKFWSSIRLPHEPTVHRMRWVKATEGKFHLVVLPLHGRGNKDGAGNGVRVLAYEMPGNVKRGWKQIVIDQSMHLTHNFDVREEGDRESIYVGGKEGVKAFSYRNGKWGLSATEWLINGNSFGEVRVGHAGNNQKLLAGIEPMHGNLLSVYTGKGNLLRAGDLNRDVLADDLNQGHALAVADFIGQGRDQVVVGWREPNKAVEMGVKLFIRGSLAWKSVWIDQGGMACEDLQIADLNADGKPDIVASGRSSHNLKIYWNRSE